MRFGKDDNFSKKRNYLLLSAAWLLTIAFVINHYWSNTSTLKSVRNAVQKNIQQQQQRIDKTLADTSLLNAIINRKYSSSEIQSLEGSDFFLFAYPDNVYSPVFWSTQKAMPDSEIIQSKEQDGFRKLANGWFVFSKKKYAAPSGNFIFVALIPIKWEYYVQNNYLQDHFEGIRNATAYYEISVSGGLPVESPSGNTYFHLIKKANVSVASGNSFALVIGLIALVIVLYVIHLQVNQVAEQKGALKGALALLISLLLLRLVIYLLNPYNYASLELFNPSVYGNNFLMGSLGDLFINSLLWVWIILFIRSKWKDNLPEFIRKKTKWSHVFTFAIALFMCVATFITGSIINSLIADPQVSFDVINFFSLTIYSVIGFLVLSCMATAYFFLIQLLASSFRQLCPPRYYRFLHLTIAGLLLLTIDQSGLVAYRLSLLLWLILFLAILEIKLLRLQSSLLGSSRFIFWVMYFSLSITAVIVVQNHEKELDARKKFAENISNKIDPTGPIVMNIIRTGFGSEYLSNMFYRFKDPTQSLLIKDSLIRESFATYLNKYNTEIFTFDSSGNPLNNLRNTTFNDLNTIIQTQGHPTSISGLYYYDVSFSNFNYISRTQINDSNGVKEGYIFIVSQPKRFKSETLYPELFSRGNPNAIESSSQYAYAIYANGKLTGSYNDYPFSTHINPKFFAHNGFKSIHKNGYDELWYQPQPGKAIVITKQDRILLESITLFAYLFCSFLFITIFFNLVARLIRSRQTASIEKPFWQLSLRNQVHGTIIMISSLSFIIIGVSTILFFINRYHDNNREFLSRTIHVMENELHDVLDSATSRTIANENIDQVPEEKIKRLINNVSNIHAVDINLYDLNGNLKASSLPLPYDKGIISPRMDPDAWYHMSILQDAQYFKEQKIGTLQYLNNYLAVRDEYGKEYAYLNIPLFESQKKLHDEISNFLVAIINLNAFIFIIAGIIALFITNRITRPLSFISNKMKDISLQTGNEEIVWNRRDEIGELVKEYNKMVRQLEVSARKLAQTEREDAWREMARQVAHEIKNPLTPMKLNLQYLEMAIEKNSPGIRNIADHVAKIILEQIEHLSQIASDFSQFANISTTRVQDFDLNDVLQNVISLYATNEKIDIHALLSGTLTITADKTQINRLFTNLLQNAVQSVPEGRKIIINLKSGIEEGNALVSIKDNGTGIPVAMQSKIFTPNFTTKSSGTGLGLAISKGIVQRVNGDIWFETLENEWTVFYVSIPLKGKTLPQQEG